MLKPCLAFLSLSVDGGIFHQKTQVHHHRFEVKEARCFFLLRSVRCFFPFHFLWSGGIVRLRLSVWWCFFHFFLVCGWWLSFRFHPHLSIGVVVLSLSLFVRGAA